MKKKISILGSTGSIGVNSLEVIKTHPEEFEVMALSAGYNTHLLCEQIQKFHPKLVSMATETLAQDVKEQFPAIQVLWGEEGLNAVATYPDSQLVISALVGAKGICPTLEAIGAKKDVALANKEVLVAAGQVVMEEVRKQGVSLLPIDSEHSAIFQVLEQKNKEMLKKITLTASGGPFLNRALETFSNVTPEEALRHPRWNMGNRISIDSATLMNKGFEVIEAHWLFGVPHSEIEVVVHPESIIHSMVSYKDGNTLACLSVPDMKAPIAYALSYPRRMPTEVVTLDLTKVKALTFEEPDFKKFPLLALAFEALKKGGVFPCLLNAADEVAVEAFLKRRILFTQIPMVIEKTLEMYQDSFPLTLENILQADVWARKKALEAIKILS